MLAENGKWQMEILHGTAHEILHSFNERAQPMNNVGEICQKDICACFGPAPESLALTKNYPLWAWSAAYIDDLHFGN